MKLIQTFFIGFAAGTLLCVLVASILESRKEPVPRLAIKCEYYLEVSEDSIWVESQEGLVYSGIYTDLDSLICEDNK
jgi:hypothetical protein